MAGSGVSQIGISRGSICYLDAYLVDADASSRIWGKLAKFVASGKTLLV